MCHCAQSKDYFKEPSKVAKQGELNRALDSMISALEASTDFKPLFSGPNYVNRLIVNGRGTFDVFTIK